MPSTVAYGDFNNDGRVDVAAITGPTTITVSLANPDGSYTVSAILTAPKNQPISYVDVGDYNGDGNLDIYAVGPCQQRVDTATPGWATATAPSTPGRPRSSAGRPTATTELVRSAAVIAGTQTFGTAGALIR